MRTVGRGGGGGRARGVLEVYPVEGVLAGAGRAALALRPVLGLEQQLLRIHARRFFGVFLILFRFLLVLAR
jgi:hypothetical protein